MSTNNRDEMQFHDADGNPCSLETLCEREPGWAASRIREERKQLSTVTAERDEAVRRAAYLDVQVASAVREHEALRNLLERTQGSVCDEIAAKSEAAETALVGVDDVLRKRAEELRELLAAIQTAVKG